MIRSLVVLALLAALGVVLVVLLRGQHALREFAVAEDAAKDPPASVSRTTRLEPLAPASSRARREPAARPVVGELPVTPAPADGLELLVIDAVTREPVAGARVRGLGLLENPSRAEDGRKVPIGLLDVESALERVVVYATDACGRTRVPRDGLPGTWSASAPGRWGMTYLTDSASPPYVIEVARERDARVLVVDALDRPAPGVPVALTCDDTSFDDLVESLSDGEGLVEVSHLVASAQKCLDAQMLCVRPLILARRESIPCLRFDPRVGADVPQRLVLPPLGRVEVRVRDADGALLDPTGVVLARAADAGFRGQPAKGAEVFEPERTEPGLAVFERIGLGQELFASSTKLASAPVSQRARGPSAGGETVVIELVVDVPYAALTGRLVGTDGVPLARTDASLRLPVTPRGHTRHTGEVSLVTDAAGRFRVPTLEPRGATLGSDLCFTYTDEGGREHVAHVALPERLDVPVTDLGDVRFEALRRIAAGKLVVPHGFALARGWVLAQPGDGAKGPRTKEEAGNDGAFEVWSELTAAHWTLIAGADDCAVTAPLEIRPGLEGLQIELGAGGVLRGRLVRDEHGRPPFIGIELVRGDSGGPWRVSLARDDSFAFAVARPGSFTLRVLDESPRDAAVLVTLSDLVLESGAECADPRLGAIDLRAFVPADDGTTLR